MDIATDSSRRINFHKRFFIEKDFSTDVKKKFNLVLFED